MYIRTGTFILVTGTKKNKESKPEPVKEEPVKKQTSPGVPSVQLDDGTGGDWDVCSGLSKKQQKYKDRKDEEKRAISYSNQ